MITNLRTILKASMYARPFGGGNNKNRKLVLIIESAQKLENIIQYKMGCDNKFEDYI